MNEENKREPMYTDAMLKVTFGLSLQQRTAGELVRLWYERLITSGELVTKAHCEELVLKAKADAARYHLAYMNGLER